MAGPAPGVPDSLLGSYLGEFEDYASDLRVFLFPYRLWDLARAVSPDPALPYSRGTAVRADRSRDYGGIFGTLPRLLWLVRHDFPLGEPAAGGAGGRGASLDSHG